MYSEDFPLSENLKRLEEITPTLPSMVGHSVMSEKGGGGSIAYLDAQGNVAAEGYPVWNDGFIAVQRLEMKAGATFEPHHHEVEREWFLVVEGEIEIEVNGTIHNLKRGEMLYSPPGETHGGRSITDSWTLCITMPSAEGYPK